MGWFHKGSGGSGTAPGDVCLSPPPPPTGPVPVPYVNMLSAGDLTKGSKTVKADGNPTALENASEVATSSGNEAGTQGGGVVTHVTKGKGSFSLWSFTVKVEGKGVCRHGDPLMQNESCTPPNIICTFAVVTQNLTDNYADMLAHAGKPCPPGKEDPPPTKTTRAQRNHASKTGKSRVARGWSGCWSCSKKQNMGTFKDGTRYNFGQRWVADHQPPQSVVWKELGGCHMEDRFNEWKKDKRSVQPQCRGCSNSQGGSVSGTEVSSLKSSLGIS